MNDTRWAICMGLLLAASCSDDPPRSPGPPARDAGVDVADAGEDADGDAPLADASEADAAPDQAGDEDGQVLPACPAFAPPVERGRLSAAELDEISGLVVSRNNARVLWMHNDSGDSARLFAVRDDGAYLGAFSLEGAAAEDWEDVALGPGREPGTTGLYVGDIGNNDLEPNPPRQIVVYRVTEPAVDADVGYDAVLTDVEAFPLSYPDGPNGEIAPERGHNAETLLVDPDDGDLFIVTKAPSGARVYRARAPLSIAGNTLELVTVLGFGQPPLGDDARVTAGDVSPGGEVALRTETSAFLWRRGEGGVSRALQHEPCPIPLAVEAQGETLAFAPDNSGYFTVSEGELASLYFYARN